MALLNYSEEKILNRWPSASGIDFDWRKVGIEKEAPDFDRGYEVRAQGVKANLAFNTDYEILAVDNIEREKDAPAYISDLIEEFQKRHSLNPKYFLIPNAVEEGTWLQLSRIKKDGYITRENLCYKIIMDTKIGKLAKRTTQEEICSIFAQDLCLADGNMKNKIEGPILVFLRIKGHNSSMLGGVLGN